MRLLNHFLPQILPQSLGTTGCAWSGPQALYGAVPGSCVRAKGLQPGQAWHLVGHTCRPGNLCHWTGLFPCCCPRQGQETLLAGKVFIPLRSFVPSGLTGGLGPRFLACPVGPWTRHGGVPTADLSRLTGAESLSAVRTSSHPVKSGGGEAGRGALFLRARAFKPKARP